MNNQQLQSSYTLTPQGQSPVQQGPAGASGGGGNWLENLMPTAGSVLGSIAGTALGGPLGMVGGSALGSAAGQGLEDAFTGASPSNIGGAAVQGGIGGVLGGVAGAGAGALLSKIGGKAAGVLASDATDAATQKVAAQEAADATNRFHEFSQAMPTSEEQTNKGLGSAIELAENMGVNTHNPGFASDMSNLSQSVTGKTGGLNIFKKNILAQAGPVDMSNSAAIVRNRIEENLGTLTGDKTEPATQLYNELKPGTTAPLTPNATPEVAVSYLQTLGKQLSKAESEMYRTARVSPTGAPDPTAVAKYKAMGQIYSDTSDQIYGRPEVQAALDKFKAGGAVTAQDMVNAEGNQAIKDLPSLTQKQVSQHMANTINNSNTIKDISSEESKFVRMGQMADDAVKTNKEAVATNAAKMKATQAAKETEQEAAESGMTPADHAKTVVAAATGPHALIPHLIQMGGKYGVKPGLGVLAKIGGAGGAKIARIAANAGGQLLAHAPDFEANGQGSALTGATGGANMQQPGGAQLANGGALTSSDLLAQLDAAMAANPAGSAAMMPVIQQLLQQVQASNAAQQGLNQYQSTLQAAGGGQGPIGGALASIGGLMGGPASQVGPQATATEALLAKAGAPGVQLPGLMQNGAGVQAGMGQAQGVLGALGAQ